MWPQHSILEVRLAHLKAVANDVKVACTGCQRLVLAGMSFLFTRSNAYGLEQCVIHNVESSSVQHHTKTRPPTNLISSAQLGSFM
jgi:hypothetical protein